jgi:hypothetical protein
MSRWFYDNGIRNGIINNFNRLESQEQMLAIYGKLFGVERIKKQEYIKIELKIIFWRTYDQQELDWLEEKQMR